MNRSNEADPQGQNQPIEGIKNDAVETASRISEQTKQQTKDKLDQNRETVSNELDKVAHATQAAASDLRDQNREGLSQFVTNLANNMSSLAQNIRAKNVDELVHDVSDLAKKNPTLFIAGSIALGIGLARFAKSSSDSQTSTGAEQEFNSPENLYPGYSDADPESRGSNWQSYNAAAEAESTAADYTDRDFPSTNSSGITSDPLSSRDNGKSTTFGGRRYE